MMIRVHSKPALQQPRLSFDEKFMSLLPFDPDRAPQNPKMHPHKERINKNRASQPAKTPITAIKLTLYVKYGNSPKLGPKAIKSALESFFYLKIKNKSNYLISIVRMIEPLSSTLSPFSNSRRY